MATRANRSYDPASSPTMGLHQIADQLGQYRRSVPWLVSYIGKLQADYGFPAPLPLYWRGKWIEQAHPQSRWNRPAVEQWFLDRLPPDAAAAVDNAARAAGGEQMDERARTMFAVIDGGRAA